MDIRFIGRSTLVAAVTAVVIAGFGSNATAGSITYAFSGVIIDTANTTAPFSFGTLTVGTTFSGSFTYDQSAVVVNTDGSTFAQYNAITAFSLTVTGDSTITSALGGIGVGDDFTASVMDQFNIRPFQTYNPSAPKTYHPVPFTLGGLALQDGSLNLFHYDSSATVFSGVALPGSGLTETDFTTRILRFNSLELLGENPEGQPSRLLGVGLVTSLQPVPEPATLLLLGTGLAAAGVRRRLKKRS